VLKLYRYLKPYWWMAAAAFSLITLQTLGDLILPTIMSDIVNKGVAKGDTAYIWDKGVIMLLIAAAGACCSVAAALFSGKTAMWLGTILRSRVFAAVEDFSAREFEQYGAATLITRSTNDITQLQTVTVMIMRQMIHAPLMVVIGIVMALRLNARLTVILAVTLPILVVIITVVSGKVMPLFRVVQKKVDRINLILREKLTGIRVIKAFNTDEYEYERFETANNDLTDTYIRVNRVLAFMNPTLMLLMNIAGLAVVWFGGKYISGGEMDLGSLTAFIQYALLILQSMTMLSMMYIVVPRAQAAAVRINEVITAVPDIADPEIPNNNFIGKGFVEFKNVTFTYHGAELPALRDISFKTGPGETTAIIGSTGSGKSTLINLIPRFYDVSGGSVLVDGVDVREMTQETLRSKIGIVPQKAVMFSGTVAENIRYGDPDASENDIENALYTAQAADFVAEAGGLEHKIARGGANLSGGQKQRLAIARALARKPEIYIFDDSFSALDFKTDAKLRSALKAETVGAAVIIVAQRVGTVMNADRIIVMDEGQIAGTGTHRELLKTCEIYREIVSSQFSDEEAAV